MGKGLLRAGAAVGLIALLVGASRHYGLDGEAALRAFRALSERLGLWAIPVYVAAHTVTLALCLPYAVFFEAGASLLFGFFPAVLCVFSAKVLGASLSFWIGRNVYVDVSNVVKWGPIQCLPFPVMENYDHLDPSTATGYVGKLWEV